MKSLNTMGFHQKIKFLGGSGGGHPKPIYKGELCKDEAWTVFRFKSGLGKKEEGGVSGGELTPQCCV